MSTFTREDFEHAARAAGLTTRDSTRWPNTIVRKITMDDGSPNWVRWNPPDEDGDALRLAVRLGIAFRYERDAPPELNLPRECAIAITGDGRYFAVVDKDEMAATRHAIFRAAIQQAESEPCKSFTELRERHRAGIDAELAEMEAEATESEPVAWRELCRRLYVELFYCDQQMQSVTKYGKPVFTQGSTVRDVLRDAKSALESATHPAPGVPDDVVRDAERYRWLRASTFPKADQYPYRISTKPIRLPIGFDDQSTFDAAIDAAMLTAPTGQKGNI